MGLIDIDLMSRTARPQAAAGSERREKKKLPLRGVTKRCATLNMVDVRRKQWPNSCLWCVVHLYLVPKAKSVVTALSCPQAQQVSTRQERYVKMHHMPHISVTSSSQLEQV